jgi:hypothetical protein
MAVALLAVFLNLSGLAYAATGGNFILGKSNSAGATTSLSATPKSGSALSVTDATSGLPAAAFKVTSAAPFTVNSQTKVANLNADLLDGLDSSAFVQRSNVVPITDLVFNAGTEPRWDIGPTFSFEANCYMSGTTSRMDEIILNNAPGSLNGSVSQLLVQPPSTSLTPDAHAIGIGSGMTGLVQGLASPSGDSYGSNTATIIVTDNTGETITLNIAAYVRGGACEIIGTAVRAL